MKNVLKLLLLSLILIFSNVFGLENAIETKKKMQDFLTTIMPFTNSHPFVTKFVGKSYDNTTLGRIINDSKKFIYDNTNFEVFNQLLNKLSASEIDILILS